MSALLPKADKQQTPRHVGFVPSRRARAVSAVRREGFAERDLWNMDWAAASVRLDVEGLDHLAPLLGLIGDELAEVGGRTRKHRAAEVSEMGLHLRVVESRVNFLVELVNNLRRCVLGRADAIPLARLVARHELTHGRDVRQHVRARGGGYRERAQPISPDIPYR